MYESIFNRFKKTKTLADLRTRALDMNSVEEAKKRIEDDHKKAQGRKHEVPYLLIIDRNGEARQLNADVNEPFVVRPISGNGSNELIPVTRGDVIEARWKVKLIGSHPDIPKDARAIFMDGPAYRVRALRTQR